MKHVERMSAEDFVRRYGHLNNARAEASSPRPVVAEAERPDKRRVRGATTTTIDGIRFPSKREAQRYLVLKLEQKTGDVLWFIRQPMFDLPGGTKYRADFLVVRPNGENSVRIEVLDAKGYATEAFKRAKKQVEALYPVKIQEV
jgi:hypothetical protein